MYVVICSLLYPKRFVRGTPEYRNARMKMIPSVVEGPLPIRIVAPPKKEMVVNCDVLPISWVITEEEIVNGKKLCAHLEATLDCITSMPIRSMACLVKRYLNRLAIDLAVVVAKPEKQKEEEPSACLGLWRFNHIDVSMCPQMPSRFESSESSDVMRVSKAMGLTTDELNSLREEVNESDSCGEKKLTI